MIIPQSIPSQVKNLIRNSHVIADFVLLHLTALLLHQLLDDKASNGVTSVPLLGIGLDHNTTIHRWGMVLLVFAGVVGMDSVTHIRTD